MILYSKDLLEKAEKVLERYRRTGTRIATAESCTGGLVLGCLTEIPGSSDVVDCGFVVYSNEAKVDLLGVSPTLIERCGAVSEDVARAMAEGAVARSRAEVAVSATGVAGPGGGSERKPVGLVHLAAARRGGETVHEERVFPGGRTEVRLAAVRLALDLLLRVAP